MTSNLIELDRYTQRCNTIQPLTKNQCIRMVSGCSLAFTTLKHLQSLIH